MWSPAGVASQLESMERDLYSDLKGVQEYFQKRGKKLGLKVLEDRKLLPKGAKKSFLVLEERCTQACQVFAICHPKAWGQAQQGSDLTGFEITEALRLKALGQGDDLVQHVVQALMEARLTSKVRLWLLEIMEADSG